MKPIFDADELLLLCDVVETLDSEDDVIYWKRELATHAERL